MSIVFDCPSCKARLSAQTLGKRPVNCPQCNSGISIEVQVAVLANSTASPIETKSSATIPATRPAVAKPPSATTPPAGTVEASGIDLSILSKPALPKLKKPFEVTSLENSAPCSVPPDEPTPSIMPSGQNSQTGSSPVSESAQANIVPAAVLVEAVAEQVQPDPNEISLDSDGTKSIHLAILQRKKRQNLFFFVTNSIQALLTLTISIALYLNMSKKTSLQPADQSIPASTMVNGEMGSKEEADPNPTPSSDLTAQEPETATVPENTDPPERPKFDFFSPKQISEIWKLTKPNLVELNIDGPFGNRKAVGLIVDSRGWMVTSYQAIKDASKIEVSAATEPLDQKIIDAPLVDLVRGRVIDDPQQDLAILAINRRFVVSLAEASIASQDRLVAEQRLLVAAPPSRTNYWGVCESIIAQRSAVNALPLTAKSRIESNGIGNPDLSWLTMEGDSELLPGTPLIDQSGTVQAMVSFPLTSRANAASTSVNKRAIAVPLSTLRTLIKKATGTITPLASNLVQTKDGQSVLLSDNHLSRKRTIELNLAALECRDFGWIPQTEEQYELLADLAKHLVAGQDFLLSDKPDHRTPASEVAAYEQVEKLVQGVTEEIATSVQQTLDEDPSKLESFNQFAEQKIKSEKSGFVPMYAEVTEGGLQFDQFIVRIAGLETHCIIPFDPVARPLRPGTQWWLVVETKKSVAPKKYTIGDSPAILAHTAFQRFEIGPLEPK